MKKVLTAFMKCIKDGWDLIVWMPIPIISLASICPLILPVILLGILGFSFWFILLGVIIGTSIDIILWIIVYFWIQYEEKYFPDSDPI